MRSSAISAIVKHIRLHRIVKHRAFLRRRAVARVGPIGPVLLAVVVLVKSRRVIEM